MANEPFVIGTIALTMGVLTTFGHKLTRGIPI